MTLECPKSSKHSYYEANFQDFIVADKTRILESLCSKAEDDLNVNQKWAWDREIDVLKKIATYFNEGTIALEYIIPRMGRRVDAILIIQDHLFPIEFKVGKIEYDSADVKQAYGYALDLSYFHGESHQVKIFPILVATDATCDKTIGNLLDNEQISTVSCCNENELLECLNELIVKNPVTTHLDSEKWLNAKFRPSPTIIEVAQALYRQHNVADISYHESDDDDIEKTTKCIDHIINKSKRLNQYSICFITGVPGAGKTLVGLNIAINHTSNLDCYDRTLFHSISNNSTVSYESNLESDDAVYLSGNGPLVQVLQTALARDKEAQHIEQKINKINNIDAEIRDICTTCPKQKKSKELHKNVCKKCQSPQKETLQKLFSDKDAVKNNPKYNRSKELYKKAAESFIQSIHKFRNEALNHNEIPINNVFIFDEAQRAWTEERLRSFVNNRRRGLNIEMSEPAYLIDAADRHKDDPNENKRWACIICLVGGGQEINNGEAGIKEWFKAINDKFPNWHVYYSDKMTGDEYLGSVDVNIAYPKIREINCISNLHLSVPKRSFRNENVSTFANALISGNITDSREKYKNISKRDESGKLIYPIYITRNLDVAKKWVKSISRGNERYGIIASSRGLRLRADGITIPSNSFAIDKWLLDPDTEIDSSYFMEVAASEFKIQGLEIDYAILAWEGDFRYCQDHFDLYNFKGGRWENNQNLETRNYLINAYRVLLTRSRQGFVIYIPVGSDTDETRKPEYYDGTYAYLKAIGIPEL